MKGRILGIDHIGLSGLNIFKTKPFFNTFQYDKIFSESNLGIFDEIKPFLSTEIPIHDAMFLKNKNGVSIEMVDYHKNNLNQEDLMLLLNGLRNFSKKNSLRTMMIKLVRV